MSSPPRPARREQRCRRGRLKEIGTEIFYPSGLRRIAIRKLPIKKQLFQKITSMVFVPFDFVFRLYTFVQYYPSHLLCSRSPPAVVSPPLVSWLDPRRCCRYMKYSDVPPIRALVTLPLGQAINEQV